MFVFIVPSGAPQDIIGNSTSPYDVMLSWQPPLLLKRNGVIRNYTIRLRQSSNLEQLSMLSTQETAILIHSLAPRTAYYYSVAASTTAGMGPFSDTAQVTTKDEGRNAIDDLI